MPENDAPVTSPAWPTDEWVHVEDKDTGHQFPVRVELFNPDAMTKTGKSPYGHDGLPVAVKYRTEIGEDTPAKRGRPADSSKATPTSPVTAATPAPDSNGQSAGSEMEN